ncbi:unnamed protein product, partial [Coregonus sp. 'balchen']
DLDERLSPVRWAIFTAGAVSFLLGITGESCVLTEAIEMLLALVMTRRIKKDSSAEVTEALRYGNASNMEMATTHQAPPMLPATQAPLMLPSTQAPPMLPYSQAHLYASAYYPPPPPYQYYGKN